MAYLIEENRILRAQLRGRRLRLTEDDRRRLAVRGQPLGGQVLSLVATILTPAATCAPGGMHAIVAVRTPTFDEAVFPPLK